MRLSAIAEIVGGELHGDDVLVTGAAYVDTRSPIAAGLFVAIVGEHLDGHSFADGAHAVLGSRPTSAPTVVVGDPVVALGRLARHVLDQLDVTVLALTGSQGKTGTKDYLAGVLGSLVPGDTVVATRGNNNNELGVPLTVLRADESTTHLVVEMGARGLGHIAQLCAIAPPHIAAVLNVGTAHVGEFGGQRAIAQAKGEIVEALPSDGVAVLNADDPLVAAMAARATAPVLDFGRHAPDHAVGWREVRLDDLGRPSFELRHAGARHPVVLRQTGHHQVPNAVAAATMAIAAGFGAAEVAAALPTIDAASPWRMEVTERADGLVVINDSYNANPESMTAALESLASIGATRGRRTIAVLGAMRELGSDHDSAHRSVGGVVARLGVDVLVVVGEEARALAAGAETGPAPSGAVGEVIITAGRAEAAAWVRQNAGGDDVVLIKASRGVALERVAEQLLGEG